MLKFSCPSHCAFSKATGATTCTPRYYPVSLGQYWPSITFSLFCFLCLPSCRGLDSPELLLLCEHFSSLPFWVSGHDSYSVTKFRLRWRWSEGKRGKGWGRLEEKMNEWNYEFSLDACAFFVPSLHFNFAVETLQSVFLFWKFTAILYFGGRFPLINCLQFLHDLFLLFITT